VSGVEDFVTAANWPALMPTPVDVLVDACDQVQAKAALAAWSLREGVPLVCVGAAGGKREAQRVEVADLVETTHDPLLASLRAAPAPRRRRAAAGAHRLALRVLARERRCASRHLRGGRRQPQLPRLWIERDRDGHLRHGGRRRGHCVVAMRPALWASPEMPLYS
jgi:hypothetical protein